MIGSWFERMINHIDTETRVKPHAGTAVRNIEQSAEAGFSLFREWNIEGACRKAQEDNLNYDMIIGVGEAKTSASSRGNTGSSSLSHDYSV